MNTNYTQNLIDHLYRTIKKCEETIQTCSAAQKEDALGIDANNTCVKQCRECIDVINQLLQTASFYLTHTKETDSIRLVNDMIEKCNICIKNCNDIISSCDTISKRCNGMIASCLNTFNDCIDACRKCAEHPDL
ncbi:MAG: hypothetical protein WD055_00455 [Candidatus Dependentiae bacterium]